MNHRLPLLIAVVIALLCPPQAQASLLFAHFWDISEESPSQWYKVEARSPHNRPGSDRHYWQSDFEFTCTDTRTDEILWTRKQDEGPPIALFVSDAGSTVIRTFMDEVICVSPQGIDRGKVNLRDAFPRGEILRYAHYTSVGYQWDRNSLWYFPEVDGRNLFVVRPWWGRRIVIDVESGGLTKISPATENAISVQEIDYVPFYGIEDVYRIKHVYKSFGVTVREKPQGIGQFIYSLAIDPAQHSAGQAARQEVTQSPSDPGDLNNLSKTICGGGALVLVVLGTYALIRRRARRQP